MRVPVRFHGRRLGLLLGALVVGCNEDATGPRPIPVAMIAVAGEGQAGIVGRALDTALTVFITDKFGLPVPGVLVRFAASKHAGTLTPLTQTTGPEGHATAHWLLPTASGVHAATVRVSGLDSLVFHAVARPAPPATVSLLSGDLQSAATAGALASAVVVLVRDDYGNPVGGAPVAFVPAAGSGVVDPGSALSDSAGRAEARWTLGEEPGLHELIVHVDSLPELKVRAHALVRLTSFGYGATYYYGGAGWRGDAEGLPLPATSFRLRDARPTLSLGCWRNALGSAPLPQAADDCAESPAF